MMFSFLVVASLAALAASTCPATGKIDCYPWQTTNLTENKCLAHGCCWDPSAPSGEPWCFYQSLPAPAPSQCQLASLADRVDCHPEPNANEDSCSARGCCWVDASDASLRGIPACFFPKIQRYTMNKTQSSASGFTDSLQWPAGVRGPFGSDPSALTAQVVFETDTRLHLRVTDPKEERWDPSKLVLPQPGSPSASSPLYSAKTVGPGQQWGLRVTRSSNTSAVLFDSATPATQGKGLLFERQYVEFSTAVQPGTLLYGLGEHVAPLLVPQESDDGAGNTFTIFSRDRGTPDHNAHGNTNLYGHHPVLLLLHPDGTSSGLVLLSSNAMDVVVSPGAITWRVIGGILDMYVLAGPTPVAVAQQLAELVGRPKMPPTWALGFHLCRWGYNNASYWSGIIDGMEQASLPLDASWHDIDLFDNHWDFTVDPNAYPWGDMSKTISKLEAGGVRYGGIVDPGIPCGVDNYPPLDNGTSLGLWVRNGTGDGWAVKAVWPGPTYFPSWFHKDAVSWWQANYERFMQQYPGIAKFVWLDMNEPATISDDDVCPSGGRQLLPGDEGVAPAAPTPAYLTARARNDALTRSQAAVGGPVTGAGFDPEYPPYLPGRFGGATYLGQKTLPMDSQHVVGLHYDVHSLYGWSESRVTSAAMRAILKERPLVISRSTFIGHAAEGAGHWLGDNTATWHDLRMSVVGILQFSSLYGVPLVGSDTCGFNGATNAELCTRWMAASAMLAPFFRNHNSIGQPEQAPFVFGEPYTTAIRTAMFDRMALIRHWTTAFYFAEAAGVPPVRPLFFDFPTSPRTPGTDVSAVDDQAMVGEGLMVSPVMDQGASSRSVVFPAAAGGWYDWWTGASMSGAGVAPGSAANVTVQCGLTDRVPVYVVGGSIVVTQEPARNTTSMSDSPVSLTAALAADTDTASGHLFWDDGVSLDPLQSGQFLLVNTSASCGTAAGSGHLTTAVAHNGLSPQAQFSSVTVLGCAGVVNGKTTATANGSPASSVTVSSTGALRIVFGTAQDMTAPLTVQWST